MAGDRDLPLFISIQGMEDVASRCLEPADMLSLCREGDQSDWGDLTQTVKVALPLHPFQAKVRGKSINSV